MALNLVSRNHRLSLYPQVKQEFIDSKDDEIIAPQTPKLTNFSISEILKPNFGLRTVKVENNFCSNTKISETETYRHDRTSCSSPESTGSLTPSSKENTTPSSSPGEGENSLWPAWVYCTRYSDRPSSGPRSRKIRKKSTKEDKRPRTAFSNEQLDRLQVEFETSRYLTESRRKDLSNELSLSETQIKIWFQNKRAKLKKTGGNQHTLALHLMAQGLYDHSTVSVHDDCE